MNPSEAFNFGRRIKDLKRSYNKTYADLSAGLKMSRERITQLEENEREPTEVERKRFADFYGLPPEELGLFAGANIVPPTPESQPIRPPRAYNQPPPASFGDRPPPTSFGDRPPPSNPNYVRERTNFNNNYDPNNERRPNPNYEPRPNPNYDSQGGNFNERQGNFNERPPQRNFNERQGNFNDRSPGNFNERQGNFNERPPQQRPGGFNDRPPQQRPGGFNERPPQQRPGGFNDRPPQQRPFISERPIQRPPVADDAERLAKPPRPSRPKEPKNTGEPKPVMKYTAEQLGDIESAYLRKQRDLKVALKFTFMNGTEYTGVVTDFTPFTVHITDQTSGEEVILRKLAMAYYRKADAIEEASNSAGKPEEV